MARSSSSPAPGPALPARSRLRRALLLAVSHGAVGAVGFAAGIYALPILIAPDAPSAAAVGAAAGEAQFEAAFKRDLAGSDALHWGEGKVSVGRSAVALHGRLAPGPDYKLYLAPEFVETEEQFLRDKPRMVRVGDVKTFENFIVPMPAGIDPAQYTTVVVWCETFGQFITAAKYR
ncbi:MAG: DM13 domain-containing protein [Rubrivivax sp.]|nr:DM13 domain-containing protein [Rubrivivax sp.]